MTRTVLAAFVLAGPVLTVCLTDSTLKAAEVVDIGSRLEVLVDDRMIERLEGGAELQLHRPIPREVAIVHDEAWEGNNTAYHTVIQDGDVYRMYYRGSQMDLTNDKLKFVHPQLICYAQSRDGIVWEKPKLGLFEFEGSKENNIIWTGKGCHNFAPMMDANPDCPPEAKYKGLGGLPGEGGLYAFQSADGIHWEMMREEPVITTGAFDSQNLAFWDSVTGEYRVYLRDFREGRDIRTASSADFLKWSESEYLKYTDGRKTELYTNQIVPYYRAAHVYLGFPTRYVASRGLLTPLNEKIARAHPRYGNDYTDGGFMTSRDGRTFHVWGEAFLRPGPVARGRWLYGGNYQNWGLVETEMEASPEGVASLLGEVDTREISLYATEGGWVGKANQMRRYTLRIDGFVSVQAPITGGQMVTVPLTFDGKELQVNYATSAAGGVRVEIQNEQGEAVPGFALEDCPVIFGDAIEGTVSWKNGPDVGSLAGKPVRLRFELKDADVFAFQFCD